MVSIRNTVKSEVIYTERTGRVAKRSFIRCYNKLARNLIRVSKQTVVY